jgi:hypothetical protein
VGKRLIGQYDVNSLGGFLGFKTRMICVTSHCARKYPFIKAALNNWVRYFLPTVGNPSRILSVMKLKHSDFWIYADDFLSFSSFETADWWFELVGGLIFPLRGSCSEGCS